MWKLAILCCFPATLLACAAGPTAPAPAADATADAPDATDATDDTTQNGDSFVATDTSNADTADAAGATIDAKADAKAACSDFFCDDGNPCTTDSCSAVQGCQHFHNTNPCEDGLACTTGDMCGGGVCVGGKSALWAQDGDSGGETVATTVAQSVDNALLIAGYTTTGGKGGRDGFVFLIDPYGNVNPKKGVLGGSKDDEIQAIAFGAKGVVIAGSTQSKGAGKRDGWFVNLIGAELNDVTLGGKGDEELYGLAATGNDYLMAGYSENVANGDLRFWVVRVDAAGKQIWEKMLNGSAVESAYGIAATSDGGSIAVGETTVDNNEHLLLVRLDKDGNLLWQKTYHDKGFDNGWTVLAGPNGFTLGGYRVEGTGPKQAWLGHIGSDGALLSEKTYGPGEFRSIIALADGSVAAGGTLGSGKSLMKIGSDGDVVWQKTYPGVGTIRGAIALNNSGFGLAGSTSKAGIANLWAAKADENGNIACKK